MKTCPTELMKMLKAIETDINEIHQDDESNSVTTVDKTGKELFKSSYNYSENRKKIEELLKKEREIRCVLSQFNSTHNVDGYDFTVCEGLIRLGQLRNEIRMLIYLSRKPEYRSQDDSEDYLKVCYDINQAKKDLKNLQRELSALQIAIDRTNLNSIIDY